MPDFSDLPCGNNCLEHCPIHHKMATLQGSLDHLPVGGAADMVSAFFNSYRTLYRSEMYSREDYGPSIALPALFDFVASAKYAERMASDAGWTYCNGRGVGEHPALYFPYLKTCPRCSVKLGKKPSAKAHKPQSDNIGEISSEVTLLILQKMVGSIDPTVSFGVSTNRRGDIDAVIYDNGHLALLEIKSSPLAVYPLEVALESELTEVKGGTPANISSHKQATINGTRDDISLYIPHRNRRIHLGARSQSNWPFKPLVEFLQSENGIAEIISAWKELRDVYTEKPQHRGKNADNRKWIICGCGSGVDDSKNRPGMDRTDDIKKGTYQALKFGAYYKDKCAKGIITAVLASNFMPLHGYDRYLAEMHDVLWTKEKYAVSVHQHGIRAFEDRKVFNLYDALLCLTGGIYHDDHLSKITSADVFAEKFSQ